MNDHSATAALVNEGAGALPSKTAVFSAEDAGVRLCVTVDAGSNRLIVREAHHEGALDAVTKRALDTMCGLVVGRPLQEAADHGAIYAMAALPGDCAAVSGIRTPHNAGPAFGLAERLIRKAHAVARSQLDIGHRENAWYLRANTDWLGKDETGQAAMIKPVLADFLRASGIGADDIWVTRIERATRVTIAFAETVSYALKPRLMMALERRLREQTGIPLELFMEEMKDANKIRRL